MEDAIATMRSSAWFHIELRSEGSLKIIYLISLVPFHLRVLKLSGQNSEFQSGSRDHVITRFWEETARTDWERQQTLCETFSVE